MNIRPFLGLPVAIHDRRPPQMLAKPMPPWTVPLLAAPNRVGVDLDVFRYSPIVGKYLYTSQSNGDNNEGFDVVVPPGWDGEFIAYVAHADGAKGCKDSPMKERFTWSSYE